MNEQGGKAAGRRGDGGETAAFFYSRLKTAALAAILAVLTLFPLAAALSGEAGFGFALLFSMTAGFFGVWLVAVLARLFWRGPVLIVSREGILDRRIGTRIIPWARVSQIYVFRARSQVYVAVVPDDPEDFIDPPGRFERLSLWASDALRLPRFSLSLMGLDATQRTIMMAFRRHMPPGLYKEPDRLPRGI
jgi:hypothetical protein